MSLHPSVVFPDIALGTPAELRWLMSEMERLWVIPGGPMPGEIEILSELYFILSWEELHHDFSD